MKVSVSSWGKEGGGTDLFFFLGKRGCRDGKFSLVNRGTKGMKRYHKLLRGHRMPLVVRKQHVLSETFFEQQKPEELIYYCGEEVSKTVGFHGGVQLFTGKPRQVGGTSDTPVGNSSMGSPPS